MNKHLSHYAYDKTFDLKVVLGHYDLISRFSDFALYLGTQLVYEHTSFTICLHMTRPLTVKYYLISWFSEFALISTLNGYMIIFLSDYE